MVASKVANTRLGNAAVLWFGKKYIKLNTPRSEPTIVRNIRFFLLNKLNVLKRLTSYDKNSHDKVREFHA